MCQAVSTYYILVGVSLLDLSGLGLFSSRCQLHTCLLAPMTSSGVLISMNHRGILGVIDKHDRYITHCKLLKHATNMRQYRR